MKTFKAFLVDAHTHAELEAAVKRHQGEIDELLPDWKQILNIQGSKTKRLEREHLKAIRTGKRLRIGPPGPRDR